MYNNHNPKSNLFYSNINLDISSKNNFNSLNKDRTNLSHKFNLPLLILNKICCNNRLLESTIIPAFDNLFK